MVGSALQEKEQASPEPPLWAVEGLEKAPLGSCAGRIIIKHTDGVPTLSLSTCA